MWRYPAAISVFTGLCVMQSKHHVLCAKTICLLYYLRVKKISLQVLRHILCDVDLSVFWGSGSHRNFPVRLSFTKSLSNTCPLLSVLLTNAADFFLEWNPEGHSREKKKKGKKAARPRKWGKKKKKSVCKSDDIHRESWQKMYVNLLKSSIAKQEFMD